MVYKMVYHEICQVDDSYVLCRLCWERVIFCKHASLDKALGEIFGGALFGRGAFEMGRLIKGFKVTQILLHDNNDEVG